MDAPSAFNPPVRMETVADERFLHALASLGACGYVQFLVKLKGQLDEARVARAMRLLLDAEPVLGCKFVADAKPPHWERRTDLDGSMLFSLQTGDSSEIEFVRNQEIEGRIDMQGGLNARAVIFRNGDGNDELLFKINHVVADARGTLQALELFAKIYNRLENDPNYSPESNGKGDRRCLQVWDHFDRSQRRRTFRRFLRDNWKRIRAGTTWGFKEHADKYFDSAARQHPKFIHHVLDPRITKQATLYARQRRCTINEVLMAAFLRACHDWLKPGTKESLAMNTLIDLRRYLPGRQANAVCSLTADAYFNLGRELGGTFEATLEKVNTASAEARLDQLGTGSLPAMMLFSKFSYARLQGVLTKIITQSLKKPTLPNFSMVTVEPGSIRFQGAEVQNVVFAVYAQPMPFFIPRATAYGDQLSLAATVYAGNTDPRRPARLFADMEREIAVAVQAK